VTSSQDWNAAVYDRISDPQLAWAREQLERAGLRGDERVLDAGCGSGRVTEELVRLVPRGRVFGVDAAPSMVEHARERLGSSVEVFCQDLSELALPEPVDVVFSNATFHWIPDHDRLFTRLFTALAPGGRLVAQCGGRGNIDAFRRIGEAVAHEEPFASHFRDWTGPWNYQGAEETAERLRRAGFTDVETWLEPKQVVLAEPRPFVSTVCLVRHLDALPPELHDAFLDRVLDRTGTPLTLDYVRLNMVARRPD
jgi:trans-aconitate 2-methyltransferase